MSLLYLFFTFILCIPITTCAIEFKRNTTTTILISFDGFRYDYIERYNLKNLKKFAHSGVKADSLKGTFVTKTFPSHFSLVTGLYDESHGIVSNHMYDPKYKEYFSMKTKSTDPKWWNSTTPIWISNELQYKNNSDVERKSGVIFWPGSQTSYHGHLPFFYKKRYDSSFTSRMRFQKIIDLLLGPDHFNFVACYFEEPDKSGHRYGPENEMVSKALHHIDKLFADFIDILKKENLYDRVNIIVVSDHGMATVPRTPITTLSDHVNENDVNIIIVSDHGMTTVPRTHIITLSDHVNENDYDLVTIGAFIQIRPKPGKKEKIYKELSKIKNITTYYKEDIPDRWHYKNNRRVPEIFAVADEGYFIVPNRNENLQPYPLGAHGYDNEHKNMHGIFMARGPDFKKELKVDTVMAIDLYELLCNIMSIKPHPNNGSLARISHVMVNRTFLNYDDKNSNERYVEKPSLTVVLLSVCGVLVIVVILGVAISCVRKRMRREENLSTNENEVRLITPEII